MKRTLWQIAIAVRAVYGVNLTAHSNEAPHSKKLWGYLVGRGPPFAYWRKQKTMGLSTVALEVARPNIVRHAILRLNNVATVRFRDRSLIPFRDQTNIHFRYRTSTRTSIDLFLGSNNGLFLGSNSGPFLRPTSQTYYGIYM